MIEARLQVLRRSLQDLTRNNRLLNHRTKGQRSLSVVHSSASEVYQSLADDGRTLQFLAREEAPAAIRDSLPNEVSDEASKQLTTPDSTNVLTLAAIGADLSSASDRRRDHHLQTLLSGEKLQTRLVNLSREATSAIEEQGCNVLYCTFGMVDWCEANESSMVSRAPLIFMPVELNRKTINSRFSVHMFDGDIVTNASLIELSQAQFQFGLPVFDTEKSDIATYYEAVRAAIDGMKGWRLSPEINIGLYSFTKLQMLRDLDPKNWPESGKLTGHPLIMALSGIETPDEGDRESIPNPSDLEKLIRPVECFQIVDADSSQQAAILAAKKGVSMVIDGPPGTGKSRTITNIIAECLASGRTILFVSEKAAALKVVKDRLNQSGLGDFVLGRRKVGYSQ